MTPDDLLPRIASALSRDRASYLAAARDGESVTGIAATMRMAVHDEFSCPADWPDGAHSERFEAVETALGEIGLMELAREIFEEVVEESVEV
jgi:hypothetical protein